MELQRSKVFVCMCLVLCSVDFGMAPWWWTGDACCGASHQVDPIQDVEEWQTLRELSPQSSPEKSSATVAKASEFARNEASEQRMLARVMELRARVVEPLNMRYDGEYNLGDSMDYAVQLLQRIDAISVELN